MKQDQIAIDVSHVVKNFRIYKDKSHTFKDRILFHKRNAYTLNPVLNDISFQVKKGEAVGLIGHNGCGKSTTLKLLNKILYPDSGIITMHGKISSLIELGAGFHPDMTGRENIYINATIFGLKKHEIDERLDDIIRFSELEEFIDNPVRTYSSGMYMRLAFSIAINVNAEILLIDEILAVGDANFQKKCFNKLEEIKKGGATIVIVSHSMSQIQSICDRAIWLDKGKIVEDGKAADVCGDYTFAMNQAAIAREQMENAQTGKEVVSNPTLTHPPIYEGRQCCRHAERMGSMRLRFHNIRLLDGKMEESQVFSYGDRMNLSFILAAEKDLGEDENYSFKINIFSNDDGNLCSSFDSKEITGAYFKGIRSQCRFTIEHINLAEGDYFISLQMNLKPGNGNDKEGEMTDSIWHFVDFTIKPDSKLSTGVTAMKNQWYISEGNNNE
jgi:ABC-type polysaccharide/polyol phosphate transport system ATPase subunit